IMTAPKTVSSNVHFADGSSLAFDNVSSNELPDITRPTGQKQTQAWAVSFTDASGSTMAAGSGVPASASFAGALWGTDNPAAAQVYALGVSDALLNLTQGGSFTAYGTQISSSTRMALAWSQTQETDATNGSDWTIPNAAS